VGVAFILVGAAMIAIAGVRFVRTAKDIDSGDVVSNPGERFDLAPAVPIGILGLALWPCLPCAVLSAL
jgi:hypothetical protein